MMMMMMIQLLLPWQKEGLNCINKHKCSNHRIWFRK